MLCLYWFLFLLLCVFFFFFFFSSRRRHTRLVSDWSSDVCSSDLIPFAVLLAVPFGTFGALLGVWLRGMPNDVYVQIGLIVVVGLAAKNAILIVEFANELRAQGRSIKEAALEAGRERLRPILMTSFAFILGVEI